jgi:hypothetical protein
VSQACASSPKGTRRSRAPLPITRSTPSFMPSCTVLICTSSLTRKPLAYISSSMQRSRTPRGCVVSGAASSASTCVSLKVLGHAQRLARGQQAQRGVGLDQVFAHGPAKEAPEHTQPPVGRGGAGGGMACRHVGQQVGLAGLAPARGLAGHAARPPAGPDRADRPPASASTGRLRSTGVDEAVDHRLAGGGQRGGFAHPQPARSRSWGGRRKAASRRSHHSSLSFCLATTVL